MKMAVSVPSWAWVLPWATLICVYATWGWLDPAHWALEPQVSGATLSQTTASGKAWGKARERSPIRPAPPWPDERALRQRLAWMKLRTLGFKLGPQRAGAGEVRLEVQWQGRLADGLEMLQVLALQWPQMSLDALDMQAQADHEWRFDWRGKWLDLAQPTDPLPPPAHESVFRLLAGHRVFDETGFKRQQFELWRGGQGRRHLLRWMQPDQLQWVASWRGSQNQAWVTWQEHTVILGVGDVVGDRAGVVKSITADELVIVEPDLIHRIKPFRPAWPTKVATP